MLNVSLKSARTRLSKLQNRLNQNGGEIFVACSADDQLVGFLIAILCQEDPANPHSERREIGMISDLCVTESHRGLGIAKALIAQAEMFFQSQDCRAISVANLSSNVSAAKLYESLGYQVVFQWREKLL